MSRILYGHMRGGPTHRFRGRKRLVGRKLNKQELIRLLVFLVLGIITLVLGMYLGWWSARNEESDAESTSTLLARVSCQLLAMI
jgi:hypothetical protein